MERKLKHFSHDHPLILKAEERKINDGTDYDSDKIIACNGCSTPISGPFYSCEGCGYLLHKVCAELPNQMNHPMHPQHPLALLPKREYNSECDMSNGPPHYSRCMCDLCNRPCDRFVYHCSSCEFDVDPVCASASHTIEDQCHMHPLTPIQHLIPIPCCHICQTKEIGLSYKCNICPFWVHQNCTVLLPSTVKHSFHRHPLTLLQSVPPKFENFSRNCDICHSHLSTFHCIYYCASCMFFSHVSCARSKEAPQSPRSRDQIIEINQDVQTDGQRLAVLPMQQQSTDLISWFAENYSDRDPITNLILGFEESYIDRVTNIKKEIKFFGHTRPLFLIDDQVSEEICEACALPISTPYYGCVECGYILHKCCTELPKQILHTAHPEHQISLLPYKVIFRCKCCRQWSNGFCYTCFQCGIYIDIKCASLLRPVRHEAHKHPLILRVMSSLTCSACGNVPPSNCVLKCDTCSFNLCFICAMSPAIMKHRYGDKHLFKLTYYPPENHYNDYICELCEGILNPKHWHYHCGHLDQFTHVNCMIYSVADSNIKYGKSYKFDDHEHELTLVSYVYDYYSRCSRCCLLLMNGFSVGLECKPCDFRIHVKCLP